jgi:4-hydroxybenzoate polyprenyltransferase
MGTVASSRSIAAELAAYARTRLLRPRIVALAVLVGACATAASAERFAAAPLSAVLALALVCQFRLWDDLEDLAYDRAHHPQRVLATTASLRTFWSALVLSIVALGVALALTQGARHALLYSGLVAALAVAYRLLAAQPGRRLLRSHLVLAKYPAFVWLVASSPEALRALAIGAALYLALCLIEIIDDPALRSSRTARLVAVAEGLALAGMLGYVAVR